MRNWCMWGKYQVSQGSNPLPHLKLLCQSLLMEGFQYPAIYLQFQKSKYCINDIFNWAMNLAETVPYIIGRKNILMLILSATNHIVKLSLTSLFSSSLVPTVGTLRNLITVVETLRHCQGVRRAYTTQSVPSIALSLISKSLWYIGSSVVHLHEQSWSAPWIQIGIFWSLLSVKTKMKICAGRYKEKSLNWFAIGHSCDFNFHTCKFKQICLKKNGDFYQKKVALKK